MPGGPGKINEYNKSLTPEKRKQNARKAGKAPKKNAKRNTDIRNIAKLINDAPAGQDLMTALAILNLKDETVSNAAGIALAVYQAAINGDMRAVEKWESYVGQIEKEGPEDSVKEDELSKSLKELAKGLESDE